MSASTQTHADTHDPLTSLGSAFKPCGFYYARLENEAIKAMSEASATLL